MVEDSLFGGVDNDLHMLLLMAGVGMNVCDDGVDFFPGTKVRK